MRGEKCRDAECLAGRYSECGSARYGRDAKGQAEVLTRVESDDGNRDRRSSSVFLEQCEFGSEDDWCMSGEESKQLVRAHR